MIKTSGASVFGCALLFCVTLSLPAQTITDRNTDPAWLSLERGKQAYASREFGDAIVAFDRAINVRRTAFTAAADRLDKALSAKPIKTANDSIKLALANFAAEDLLQRDYALILRSHGSSTKTLLEAIRRERISESHRAFIEVLLQVLEYRPIESLDDSIQVMRSVVARLQRYPEAEYWKGKVFMLEGEMALAESQMQRALSMRDSLEITDEQYSIMYSMADLYGARDDYVAWENVMNAIVAGDESLDPYLEDAMMATLVDGGFNRFMVLYRIEPTYAMEANAALAEFYLDRGRAPAMLHAAVALNMSLTRAVNMLRAKDRDFAWTTLQDFMKLALQRSEVTEFLESARLYRQMLTLADAMYISGARTNAIQLWKAIVSAGILPQSSVASARLADPSTAVRRSAP
jgi:tetratricopeptide (TPR) repeat protein